MFLSAYTESSAMAMTYEHIKKLIDFKKINESHTVTCNIYTLFDLVQGEVPHIYRRVGNLQGRKFLRIGKRWPFHGESFRGMLKPAAIIGWYGTLKFHGENFQGWLNLTKSTRPQPAICVFNSFSLLPTKNNNCATRNALICVI